ncbi:protein-L-isoaspartate O-methyltransferase [Rhodobacteraceae bacterium RKSG542]|uniref:protein-L-isoaspartate O-methyltransferase family protein n=1 Tax=Pseudovibrio flavus TaxID=2529854 RepID=UPI0012BC36CB|nr:protein-L-isoaspartate O-methyltransferase [Pseudovibrio flavus]MTI17289.1 protein-L-isoaspartate O-methyltransferase [Pseudovibrio flavus]
MVDFSQSRKKMVDNQLRPNDITDRRILQAMGEIPRERFVPESFRSLAYIDEDLPVVADRSRNIPKPHIFGRMVQLAQIKSTDVVLFVGATAGYGVSVVSKLCDSVVGIDEDEELVNSATETLVDLGIENAAVVHAAHKSGYPADAPYDVIFINGAIDGVPESLLGQLKDEGRLVVVEGLGGAGVAMLYQKNGEAVTGRFGFNANAPRLPGFEQPVTFNF